MILFAFIMANKEIVAVRMMREYVPTPNPFSEPFHFYGFGCSVVVGVTITLLQTTLAGQILSPLLSGVLYWTVFDWKLNHEVYDKFDRIGRSSWIDRKLWEWFGKHAERNAVRIKVGSVILLNAIYAIN